MQNSDVTLLTSGRGNQTEEGGLVVKDVVPSPQLVETFTLRPRGPDALLRYLNEATEPFNTSSG